MIGGHSSQKFCSGSLEYPTHEDLFRGLLVNLRGTDSWEWIHFQAAERSHWLEIADDADSLLVNISFPFSQPCDEVLREAGVIPPAAWQRTAFRRRGWLSAGYTEFLAPRDQFEQVVAFAKDVFQRLFRVASHDPIEGWLAR